MRKSTVIFLLVCITTSAIALSVLVFGSQKVSDCVKLGQELGVSMHYSNGVCTNSK